MVSQPSGSNNELVLIETQNLFFIIKGEDSAVGYGSEKSFTALLNENEELTDINQYICFKEYTDYEVVIEKKRNVDIEFYHESINIRDKVTPTGRTGNILSGVINFRGDIGYSDIFVLVNGRVHLKITVEVLPSKLDYKEDYKAILNDVNREIYNLAYGFLGRTYLGAEINNKRVSSYSEFYSILAYVYDKLIKSIDLVIYNPHHELIRDARVCKYHMLKNISKDTVKWLEKRPHLIKKDGESYRPVEALQVSKRITYDTRENRFLKYMLQVIVEKIENFIKLYASASVKHDADVVNKLKSMRIEINKRLNTSFLKDVRKDFGNNSISQVFTMGVGYRDIYKYYLMLQKGLSINSNIFSLSMKELFLLYEYWCFIKINSLLQQQYKLLTADFVKVNRDRIFVTLKRGISSNLTYENTRTNERFIVSYNPMKDSRTISQRPDNILSIYKEGSSKAYEFVFDAKYRIDTSADYCSKYGGIGPKEEDINTMHRYRDAIVYSNKNVDSNRNCIFGAFVLFPYKNEEEYEDHSFYKSIEEINIGGLPFLPSSTGLMKEFLDRLINESPYSTFERAPDIICREDYLKDEYFDNRTVLVGSLRDKDQLDVNLRSNFYHTSCTNVNLAQHKIQYVALAQSKSTFRSDAGIKYYGAVESIKVVKRREITELPKDSDEYYYVFEIDEWKELDNKIEVLGYQVRKIIYTTEFLLKNSRIVTNLCIKSKEEYRLWQEFKRINSDVFTMGDKDIDNESEVIGFSIEGVDIVITNEEIVVGDKVVSFSKNDFNRRPRVILQEMLKAIIRIKKNAEHV